MRKIALGLAAVLLSTAAYAQTSTNTTAGGSVQQRITTPGSETNVRTRTEGGARVGVETRERAGVSVHSRTTREIEEPSVRRRHAVTTVEESRPEVHHTIIKKKTKPTKKVVIRKKKPNSRYVVRTHTRHYVEEPSVRRRTVHRYETSEPSVVSRRTTVRHSQDIGTRTGVSVERRSSSPEVGVSATTRQRSGTRVESTGTVSGRSSTSGASKLQLQQNGQSQ